ncbi:MAG: Xaa-Pro aminopeptidase [bacterium (Candidatus Stahlbacteria) CG23_combo_of_CG06-09_8_20_14_all_34_7]|nr:MAG: Xaa-Pro aminopeptidase [bacterium (Candidatus Stahlbacteria) CG23_combo_of_CG06-09_8_20_14_all_34_7]
MFPRSIFKERRKKVFKSMKENSIMLLESAFPKEKNTGNQYIFRQDSSFYYLTGFSSENSALLLIKSKKERKEILFVEENNPYLELWLGKRKSFDEVKKNTGIEKVCSIKEIFQHLSMYVNDNMILYFDFTNREVSNFLDFQHYRLMRIKEHYPQIMTVQQASKIIYPVRMLKDEFEIKAIRKAIEITRDGIVNAMKNVKVGMYEYEVQADIEYMFLKNGVKVPAFPSIIAAGVNAAILHYSENNCIIEKDSLVLTDVGAEFMNYSADITRVFPASGKFTKKQATLYSGLLEIQNKIIDMVKPGVSFKEINDISNKLISQMLIKMNYIKEESDVKKYYAHSIGHMLGLDTHDVNTYPRNFPILKENMVLTIEPGIYIKEESIGLRIEDDILVTNRGNTNLSYDIPKAIKEIEKRVT